MPSQLPPGLKNPSFAIPRVPSSPMLGLKAGRRKTRGSMEWGGGGGRWQGEQLFSGFFLFQ